MSNITTSKSAMSTKLGGRVFEPFIAIADGNPTTDPTELAFHRNLLDYSERNIPIESTEGITTRERVLERMKNIAQEWVLSVSQREGVASGAAHCELLTSGSYRLGVHEPGADIDTILVAPAVCKRSDFFGTLSERIRQHPDVTNFVPVEGAAVPLLTFDWEGINIDLLFARLSTNTVPVDFDVNNDTVLDGVDSATEKSLNGPRVTNLIAAFCGNTPERYGSFLTTVRCVRRWAKARGLYSNKMGYWGGVNINIAVAMTIQLYPNLSSAQLLRKFFLVFTNWRWPQPVQLTPTYDAGYGLPVWNASTPQQRHVAPMITPAYPAMNSTFSVSRQSLQILQKELKKGWDCIDGLWRTYQEDYREQGDEATVDWEKLFEPSEFFINYPHFLSLCIVGPSQADVQAWAAFVESRLRKLVSDLLSRSLPLKRIQLWPKKIEACIADQSSLLTAAQRQNCLTYFIGFFVDRVRMRGDHLNMEGPLINFREWDLHRFQPLEQGMDLLTKVFTVRELPPLCFESLGGKPQAMRRLRQMRNWDPARQERKLLAQKQANLAAKKAELEEKLEEQKKRKRTELEDSKSAEEQAEETSGEQMEVETNEASALEVALDTVQGKDGDQNMPVEGENEIVTSADEGAANADVVNQDGYESDENIVGYSKDEVRQVIVHTKNKAEMNKFKGKRLLPVSETIANALQSIGYPSRDDVALNMIGSTIANEANETSRAPLGKITFCERFDIVELDGDGRVIDKGDDDFSPSRMWNGRKPGFEFKLGERGIGYYRTGTKVVVPSNTTY